MEWRPLATIDSVKISAAAIFKQCSHNGQPVVKFGFNSDMQWRLPVISVFGGRLRGNFGRLPLGCAVVLRIGAFYLTFVHFLGKVPLQSSDVPCLYQLVQFLLLHRERRVVPLCARFPPYSTTTFFLGLGHNNSHGHKVAVTRTQTSEEQ